MSTGRIHWKGKNTQGIKHSTSYILNAQQILITVNLFLFSVSLWFWCDAQPHFIEKAIETERSHDTHRMRKIIGNWWLKWGKTYLGCNPGQFMLSPSFSYTFTSSFLPPSAPPTSNIYLPKLQKNPQCSTLCVKLASTGSDKAWGRVSNRACSFPSCFHHWPRGNCWKHLPAPLGIICDSKLMYRKNSGTGMFRVLSKRM